MQPFEDLIRELGNVMEVSLHVDAHQSCLLHFPTKNVSVQIDLDTRGDRILIGTQLGQVPPGTYREQMLFKAMQINGRLLIPHGILAYSEKNDALILFQFLLLPALNGVKIHHFLQGFTNHARVWNEAIQRGEIPFFEDDQSASNPYRPFGLT